jgi:hypothetical protein
MANIHPGRPVLVYLLLAIFLILAAQFALFVVGCRQDSEWQRHEHDKKLYTRDEFNQLLLGKTDEQVIHAVGKPDTTSQKDNVQYWQGGR